MLEFAVYYPSSITNSAKFLLKHKNSELDDFLDFEGITYPEPNSVNIPLSIKLNLMDPSSTFVQLSADSENRHLDNVVYRGQDDTLPSATETTSDGDGSAVAIDLNIKPIARKEEGDTIGDVKSDSPSSDADNKILKAIAGVRAGLLKEARAHKNKDTTVKPGKAFRAQGPLQFQTPKVDRSVKPMVPQLEHYPVSTSLFSLCGLQGLLMWFNFY